ncbi:hypothetical protein HDU96_004683 [Phlyctochytrium bullatum]|nr:hypothetical protein HDU96_004683 [Phlyctochytrium bullatum]
MPTANIAPRQTAATSTMKAPVTTVTHAPAMDMRSAFLSSPAADGSSGTATVAPSPSAMCFQPSDMPAATAFPAVFTGTAPTARISTSTALRAFLAARATPQAHQSSHRDAVMANVNFSNPPSEAVSSVSTMDTSPTFSSPSDGPAPPTTTVPLLANFLTARMQLAAQQQKLANASSAGAWECLYVPQPIAPGLPLMDYMGQTPPTAPTAASRGRSSSALPTIGVSMAPSAPNTTVPSLTAGLSPASTPITQWLNLIADPSSSVAMEGVALEGPKLTERPNAAAGGGGLVFSSLHQVLNAPMERPTGAAIENGFSSYGQSNSSYGYRGASFAQTTASTSATLLGSATEIGLLAATADVHDEVMGEASAPEEDEEVTTTCITTAGDIDPHSTSCNPADYPGANSAFLFPTQPPPTGRRRSTTALLDARTNFPSALFSQTTFTNNMPGSLTFPRRSSDHASMLLAPRPGFSDLLAGFGRDDMTCGTNTPPPHILSTPSTPPTAAHHSPDPASGDPSHLLAEMEAQWMAIETLDTRIRDAAARMPGEEELERCGERARRAAERAAGEVAKWAAAAAAVRGRNSSKSSTASTAVGETPVAGTESGGHGSEEEEEGAKRGRRSCEVEPKLKDGEAVYECPECSKVFTRHYNLKSHAISHSGDRPFICRHCFRAFSRKHDMKRHERSHV